MAALSAGTSSLLASTTAVSTPTIMSTRTEKEEVAFRRIIELDTRCRDPLPTRRRHAVFSFVDVFDESPTTVILYTGVQKLADLFETTDNTMRFAVVQVLREAQRHFSILENVDQAARRIMMVTEKRTDRVAYRLALLALDCLVDVLGSPYDVYYNVIKLLSIPDKGVRRTALRVCSRLYHRSMSFQRIALPDIVSHLKDTVLIDDDNVRKQILRILGQTRCSIDLILKTMQSLVNYALLQENPIDLRCTALRGWANLLSHTVTRFKQNTIPTWTLLLNDTAVTIRIATMQHLILLFTQHDTHVEHVASLYDNLVDKTTNAESKAERIWSIIALHIWHKTVGSTSTNTKQHLFTIEREILVELDEAACQIDSQIISILLIISDEVLSPVIVELIIRSLEEMLKSTVNQLPTNKLYRLLKRITHLNAALLSESNAYERILQLTRLSNLSESTRHLLLSCLLRLPVTHSRQLTERCRANLNAIDGQEHLPLSVIYVKLTLRQIAVATTPWLEQEKKEISCKLLDIIRQLEANHTMLDRLEQEKWYWTVYNLALLCGQAGLFAGMHSLLTPILNWVRDPSVHYWLDTLDRLAQILDRLDISTSVDDLMRNFSISSMSLFKLMTNLQLFKTSSGQSLPYQLWWTHLHALFLQLMSSTAQYFIMDKNARDNVDPALMEKYVRTFDELADQFHGLTSSFPSTGKHSWYNCNALDKARSSCQLLFYFLRWNYLDRCVSSSQRVHLSGDNYHLTSMSEVMFQRIDTLDASDSQQALSLLKELTVWSISQQFCNPATKQLLIHMDAIPGTIQLSRGQHTFLSISGRLSSDFIQNSRCLFVAVVIEMTLVHNNSAWKAPRNGNYYDYMWGRTYFMAGPLGQRWCRESSSTSTIELTTVSQSWLSHWLTPLADRLPEQYVVPLIDHRFECKMVVPQPSTLGEDHGNGCILQIRLSLKDTRERLWCAHTDKQMVIQCIQNNE